ncbi:hypothetical protein TBK1r_75850 [Stieleria magnilauensis]|uniref:Uncharacterized protein n=1 Tax=Stieleria magnilauensis TaxID=2527963 RepID=A0ABX5Y409_9BACT|nr:hypothetical protein TBK1r_75850 [Planctomycetes bacterium TBK1r]
MITGAMTAHNPHSGGRLRTEVGRANGNGDRSWRHLSCSIILPRMILPSFDGQRARLQLCTTVLITLTYRSEFSAIDRALMETQ